MLGLHISVAVHWQRAAGANDKPAQLDRRPRNTATVDLGMPAFANNR